MMNKRFWFRMGLVTLIAVLVGVIFYYGVYPYYRQPDATLNPDPNHTHANFAVWIDGEPLDFTDSALMSGVPVDTHDVVEPNENETDAEEGSPEYYRQYLHLHDGVGHVIHRHKPGLTLENFFTSLQLAMTQECYASFEPLADGQICPDNPFRLFVNGEEQPFTMNIEFQDLDQILLTNAVTEERIQAQLNQLKDDACLYSKACPWRGDPPAENCIADPEVPCVLAE